MKRRHFIRHSFATSTLLFTRPWTVFGVEPTIVLRGGHVIDGTGKPGRDVDVAITGDRITAIGRALKIAGAEIVDVRGLVVAPGFIDIHSHTDMSLFVDPHAQSKVRQGVTTEVPGQDGSSVGPRKEARSGVRDIATFFTELQRNGTSVNVASMVGAGTIRDFVIGEEDRRAAPAELEQMKTLVREAVAAGACGLSSGLEYVPGAFANRAELVALATMLQGTGLAYATHMRNEDDELLAAVEEAIAIGRFAGVPVQISHLKSQGQRNWFKTTAVIETIEAARRDGIDVMFDRYPYVAYSTGLSNLFPVWARNGGNPEFLKRLADPAQQSAIRDAVNDKIRQLGSWDAVQISSTRTEELVAIRGRRMGELAKEKGRDPYELLVEIMNKDEARTGMIGFGMDEPNTERYLAHPLCMICSDGGAMATEGPLSQGSPHPRSFGTFPRVLGHYVRERRIMSLETAIAKMSLMPAKRLKLRDRGELRVGAFADVVAFNPNTVTDRATFENPKAYPVGIEHVWVNGVQVIRDSAHTHATPGRPLKP